MASGSVVLNGNVNLLPPKVGLANAGAMFNVTNPTPGTAIAYALQTGFSATANGLFCISNNNPAGSKNIILDRLFLKQTATAPTGTLTLRMETYIEQGIRAMSGAVATRTPVNVNGGFADSTGAVVQSFAAGAATVPAAVGSRKLTNVLGGVTGVTVIHDEFIYDFSGTQSGWKNGGAAARATDAASFIYSANPVIIAPSTTCFINLWWVTAAANTPSFEFDLSYFEL